MAEIKRLCGQEYVDEYAWRAGSSPDAGAKEMGE